MTDIENRQVKVPQDLPKTGKFDPDELHDFVVAHGFGSPTTEGYELGRKLIAAGDDYATAAMEIVARGLTTEPE